MALWELEDLEAEVSKETVLQCLDDDNDGTADAAAVARLQRKSDSSVLGWLGGIYGVDALVASNDERLKDLAIDYAVMALAKRHPEYVKRDWKDLYDAWRSEIEALRKGLTQLARDTPPEPAANQRAHLDSVSEGVGVVVCHVFNKPGGFGY